MDYVPRATLNRAFQAISRQSLVDRLHAVRALAQVRGMSYVDDAGRARSIDIALKPWVMTSAQLLYFHRVAHELSDALLRVAHLYAKVPAIRTIVPFEPARADWMRLTTHPRSRPLAVMGRLDSTAVYDHAGWQRDFRMLEPNAVGVGGVHYAPTGCSIVMDIAGDLLTQAMPGRVITPTPDPRQLLIEELRTVARRLNRNIRGVALIENTDFTTGTDEFQELARYLNSHGLKAVVADPRAVRLTRGGFSAGGVPVDFFYRDSELSEFVEMESKGKRLSAMREAVRQGRLISSLTWEFDQKSTWEIFTDSQYSRFFTASQQRLFKDHLLWTRLVRPAKVTDAAGRGVDLPSYIRKHRLQLVLKPNTLFGGQGVTIGKTVSQSAWEKQLHRALHGRERYAVQALAKVPTDDFPSLTKQGAAWQERHVVSGFFFTSSGIGLVGRFSGKPVVNVSQGGGLIAALWAH